ncbi:MAG: PEP-CTERM sorting domain-containing protein [Pacificimonas sp.]
MTIAETILRMATAGAALTLAGAAYAAPVHINLNHETQNTGHGYGNAKLYEIMDGNGGTVNVKATAWSILGGGGWNNSSAHANAYLGEYGGGLGVTNRFEDGTAPGHQIDNGGSQDYIVLQFDQLVRPENVGVTLFNNNGVVDGDVSILVGNVPLGFDQFLDPTTAFPDLSTFLNYDTDYWQSGHVAGQTRTRDNFDFGASDYGNVVIVAADLFRTQDHIADAFKLKFINLDVFENPQNVPAPGVIGLMGLGLAGLGALRRRKRAAS